MLTAVILAKNEEKNIISCIRSIIWCDEIIIVDDYSSDRTAELIREFPDKNIKIFKHHLGDDFASQRNFGLEKARSEWVLFIDADERVTPSLQFEILNIISSTIDNFSAFKLRRIDTMWGKTLRFGEVKSMKLVRLAKKDSGLWRGKVHERWDTQGKVGELKNPLVHYPHQDLESFLKEINFYTDLRAGELFSKQSKSGILSIIIYPVSKFLFNYFFRLGILDGIHGLLFAVLMSFHSFLVRGKLWKLWEEKRT